MIHHWNPSKNNGRKISSLRNGHRICGIWLGFGTCTETAMGVQERGLMAWERETNVVEVSEQ